MDVNEMLIEEVKKYNCVYNLKSPDYKNFKKKEEIWLKIGETVGLSASEAKKKWTNMRDYYKKYKQKETPPSGSENPFNRPYKYADHLRFLDDVPASRSTVSNISDETVDTIMELSSDSEATCSTPIKRQKKDPIQEQMQDFLSVAKSSISNLIDSVKTNPTTQLFETLANKINNANLSLQQVNAIESAVVAVVYSKLSEFTNGYEI